MKDNRKSARHLQNPCSIPAHTNGAGTVLPSPAVAPAEEEDGGAVF